MIRAFLLALFVLLVVQARPATVSEAGNQQLSLEMQCSSQGVTVFFSWTGASPEAVEQWVDLSLHNNGWQQGTFLGSGPMAPTATSHAWDGLISNAVHYVRINQLLPHGAWDPARRSTSKPSTAPAVARPPMLQRPGLLSGVSST